MLPTFSNPPLEEVALSVQFAPITGLGAMHLGLLWRKVRAKYPKTSEQTPLSTIFETFGPRSVELSSVNIEAFLTLPLPRLWMESEDGSELFQFQQDRAVHNWRKRENSLYPRFETVKSHLSSDLDELNAFLKEEGLEEIEPNQCEVTYINLITFADGSNPHGSMQLITNLVNEDKELAVELHFDSQSLSTRYQIHISGNPVGRLYATFAPVVIVASKSPAIKLEMTVRGQPKAHTVAAALEFLDLGRTHIVKTFERITSQQMHQEWGKIER